MGGNVKSRVILGGAALETRNICVVTGHLVNDREVGSSNHPTNASYQYVYVCQHWRPYLCGGKLL
jgi:hypothetical protein